jgi:hypothetical protein
MSFTKYMMKLLLEESPIHPKGARVAPGKGRADMPDGGLSFLPDSFKHLVVLTQACLQLIMDPVPARFQATSIL